MLLCRLRPAALGFIAHAVAEVLPAAEDMLLRLERGNVHDDNQSRFAYELRLPKLPVPTKDAPLSAAVCCRLGPPWEFPSFGKCHLVTQEVQSLHDEELDSALREVIFNTAAAAHAEGFDIQLSRHHLFHGHFFRRKNGEVMSDMRCV